MTSTRRYLVLSVALGLLLQGDLAFAGSGTWKTSASNGSWNLATNWSSGTIPNGSADTATFSGGPLFPAVSLGGNIEVNGVVFAGGNATSYTIITSPAILFTISGAGVTNNSNLNATETIATSVSGAFGGLTRLTNSAIAGNNVRTVYNSLGGDTSGFAGGTTQLRDTATA